MIIFAVSVAVLNILLIIIVGVVVGEFVLGVIGIGGMAGLGMYAVVKKIFIANIRDSWSPELDETIIQLKKEKIIVDTG